MLWLKGLKILQSIFFKCYFGVGREAEDVCYFECGDFSFCTLMELLVIVYLAWRDATWKE